MMGTHQRPWSSWLHGRIVWILAVALAFSGLFMTVSAGPAAAAWPPCTTALTGEGNCVPINGGVSDPATLTGPSSLTVSPANCPKGSNAAQNGYSCSTPVTFGLAIPNDSPTVYNIHFNGPTSETNSNIVYVFASATTVPNDYTGWCEVDPTTGGCKDGNTKSLPLYLVAVRPIPNDTALTCVLGQAQYGDAFGDCIQIHITNKSAKEKAPPTATFTATQDTSDPYTFAFDGSNSLAPSPSTITSWSWNFGDSTNVGSGETVSHTYAANGHYNVVLTVTDSDGETDTYTVALDVSGLVVELDPGSTNGKLFSVEITVKNEGTSDLSDVSFADPDGITIDTQAQTSTAGKIIALQEPDPALPTTLSQGASATSTVVYAIRQKGGIDLDCSVTAEDSAGASDSDTTSAVVRIGERKPSQAEQLDQYSDALIDASDQEGTLLNSEAQRYGDLLDWATSSSSTGAVPAWLNTTVADGTTPPSSSSLPEVAGWKVLAARAAGLPDNALAWMPDNPVEGLQLYATMEAHIATSTAGALKSTAVSARDGLANAATFYGQLSSGDPAFQAAAEQQLEGLVSDAGAAAAPKIALIGSIIAYSDENPIAPGSLGDYQSNPVLQQFTTDSTKAIDKTLKSAETSLVADVHLAQTNPRLAAAKIGDFIGSTGTQLAIGAATSEFGAAVVPRFAKAVEAAIPSAESGVALDASATVADPAQITQSPGAPLIATGSRQTLESLGAETPISVGQLESLGGFYGPDATQVQRIIKDVKAEYGVNVEVQVRPGNPASLPYYADGTGVPKPEWIKPKATEWTDVLLGAPPESLGKATLYQPVLPSPEVLATYSETEQAAITARYNTQKDLYAQSFDPNGSFQKLLADSKTDQGATQTVALGTKDITGLRYSLQDIPGHPGAKYIIDDAAGGKYILSDADYQAVVSADTGKAIPAANQRGAIELYVMNRLQSDTVSFGGHGWTVSGFDLPSQYSKPWLQFATGSMDPVNARSTIAWWLESQSTPPKWVLDYAKKLGHQVTVDDLMGLFSPGQFVVKFNGTTMRVGYGASIGK